MRDLLDLIQYLTEDRTLNPATIIKRPGRFEKFLSLIKTGSTFYTVDKKPVIINPKEAKRMQQLFNDGEFKGAIKLQTNKGVLALSDLLKTADLGGQASTGQKGEELSKESALLKPTQIGITDKDIPASELGKVIINNSVLKSTDYGRVVINMAKQIVGEGTPVIPKELVKTKIGASILDYAGEYLGILALVSGRSRFPRLKGFTKWLGADPSQLTISFPSVSNMQLADSFATIKNKKSHHTVNISSKGGGGGAAPSLSGLKISDEIRNDKKFKAAVSFIDLCNSGDREVGAGPKISLPSPRTVSQVFEGMNLIYKYAPSAIPKEFHKFLPWQTNNVVTEVMASINAFKQGKVLALPKYKKLTDQVESRTGASDGGKLVYVVKQAVMTAVNEKQALPNFQELVLNILDMNFVQQYADLDKKTGVMSFATQWPAKFEGKITLESKSTSSDPTKGGFSFKLSNEEPKTDLPEPEETLGGDVIADKKKKADISLSKAAKAITRGGAKPISMSPKKSKGVGRAKRKK